MGLGYQHELHKRRFSRNVGVGVLLGSFAVLVFALSVVKVTDGAPTQGFDHALRIDQLQASE